MSMISWSMRSLRSWKWASLWLYAANHIGNKFDEMHANQCHRWQSFTYNRLTAENSYVLIWTQNTNCWAKTWIKHLFTKKNVLKAKNNKPVRTHITSTEHIAPITSALWYPNDIFWVAGLLATHRAKSEMRKLAKSLNMWEASVMMARELARNPPGGEAYL